MKYEIEFQYRVKNLSSILCNFLMILNKYIKGLKQSSFLKLQNYSKLKKISKEMNDNLVNITEDYLKEVNNCEKEIIVSDTRYNELKGIYKFLEAKEELYKNKINQIKHENDVLMNSYRYAYNEIELSQKIEALRDENSILEETLAAVHCSMSIFMKEIGSNIII